MVVVEPGGHVGRLPLNLSTCPRGGCQEHGIERWSGGALTSALGLQPPWVVEDVKLDVPAKRIDSEVSCSSALQRRPRESEHPSSTPKAEFERFSRPGANVINKLALQRQFFCSGTT
jgi:hypothetical protein